MPAGDEGQLDRASSRASFLRAVLGLRRTEAPDAALTGRVGSGRDPDGPDQPPNPAVPDGKGDDDSTPHPA